MSVLKSLSLRLAFVSSLVLLSPAVIAPAAAATTGDFSLADLKGKEHKLADEKGKWVIINYWATWCPPCVEEIPELVFFHDKHKDKDAIVWGVNFEDIEDKKVSDFLEEYMVSYTVLLAEPGLNSYFGPVMGLPTTYFISPEGEMVHTRVGRVTIDYIESIMKKHEAKQGKWFMVIVTRHFNSVTLLALLGLCFLAAFPVFAAEEKDPYKYFFNETWGEFNEELDNAKAQNKKAILVFFELDECPFCHFMKLNVLNKPEVQAYFRKHFLNFPVDIEGDIEMTGFNGKAMSQKYFSTKVNRVRATPVFVFFDLEGNKIARYTGRTSNAEEFMWLGQYVVEGIYNKMSFTKYKRNKKKQARM